MKVTVSVPEILDAAFVDERKLLKISKSEFYQKALRFYLMTGVESDMIRRINKVCAEIHTSGDPALKSYLAARLALV